MDGPLFISIIIPVYNAGQYFDQCLDAVNASTYPSYEVIVVDDGSTDDSAEIARGRGATVLRMERQSGPAAARNRGAREAKGDVVLFVDADVLVRPETAQRVVQDFMDNPGIAAVFGSYDDNPMAEDFFSQYRNLYHHFVHQQSSKEALTFWAGCGAIRIDVFNELGGFDEKMYAKPSIEDIELGYRIRSSGYRILLDKELQVKHMKRWRFFNMVMTDIFCRAVPWSRLMLGRREVIKDLNLQISHRVSSGLVGLSAGMFPFLFLEPRLIYFLLLFFSVIIILNRKLYGFFLRRKGLRFTSLVFPMQLLYYFYSGTAFVLCWSAYHLIRKR